MHNIGISVKRSLATFLKKEPLSKTDLFRLRHMDLITQEGEPLITPKGKALVLKLSKTQNT